MIRRLTKGSIHEVSLPHALGRSTNIHTSDPEQAAVVEEGLDAAAGFRSGYKDGYEAGEADGLSIAREQSKSLEDEANRRLEEASAERDRFADLCAGLESALSQHIDSMEAVAFEVALEGIARAFGESGGDAELLRRTCAQLSDEFRGRGIKLMVSEVDASAMPDRIGGIEWVTDASLASGQCRLITERGWHESSVDLRLKAIYRAMRESLGLDHP